MKKSIAMLTSLFAVLLVSLSFAERLDGEKSNQEEPRDANQPQEFTNSIGIRFRLIPAGSFMMGASPGDSEVGEGELPRHSVEITRPFHIGEHEVTQEIYEQVMGENPSEFKGADRPVERISWNDAVAFCTRLSEMTGESYRLPTEAEWEYACRAGTETRYYWGDAMDGDYAWHDENSGGETHPAGQKNPNEWGLYDMSGNVWEWCGDWFAENYYFQSPPQDPSGPESGTSRVVRGGSWYNYPKNLRSSSRFGFRPDRGNYYIGFRVVREVE